METMENMEKIETTETMETTETIEMAYSSEKTETTDLMEAMDSTETMETTETIEMAYSSEKTETTDSTETIGTTETMEIAYSLEKMEITDSSETTDSTETTETTEKPKKKETMADIMSDGPNYLVRYDPDTMDFFEWLNAFEYIVEFLQIKYKRIVDFFFYMMETSAIMKFQKEFSMSMLFRLQYEVLITKIANVFGYTDETLVAESRFWDRDQFIGEHPNQYMDALIKLITKCNSSICKHDILKNRFLQGLIKKQIIDRYTCQGELSLEKVVELATIYEFYDAWSIIHEFL